MSIQIGAHPSNLTLTALAHEPSLQESLRRSDLDIGFRWYAEGRLIHEALDAGEINVVGTGSTRAIVAQADGVPITYIAASQPRTTGAAILVPDESPIKSPRDLTGRRVGLIDGSFHTYFLVAVLEAAGVPFSEVKAINWPIKDSERALRAGEFDAWISMAPYLAPALSAGGLRSLVGCDAVIPNRSVFWVGRDVVDQGKPAVEIIARSLADTDRWIAADTKRAGRLFARVIGGVSEESWAFSIAGRKWGLVPADETVLAEQQREADLLARHGLLKRTIDLRDSALKYPLDFDRRAA